MSRIGVPRVPSRGRGQGGGPNKVFTAASAPRFRHKKTISVIAEINRNAANPIFVAPT